MKLIRLRNKKEVFNFTEDLFMEQGHHKLPNALQKA